MEPLQLLRAIYNIKDELVSKYSDINHENIRIKLSLCNNNETMKLELNSRQDVNLGGQGYEDEDLCYTVSDSWVVIIDSDEIKINLSQETFYRYDESEVKAKLSITNDGNLKGDQSLLSKLIDAMPMELKINDKRKTSRHPFFKENTTTPSPLKDTQMASRLFV